MSADGRRIFILGNGGSGKTWLAERMAEALGVAAIHLDDIHWEPGHKGIARDRTLRDEMVRAASLRSAWVMEGIYGQLADLVMDRMTTLIWLDLPIEECLTNIRTRGPHKGESPEQFQGLLDWVAEYRTRVKNWNSFEGHQRLLDGYAGEKARV